MFRRTAAAFSLCVALATPAMAQEDFPLEATAKYKFEWAAYYRSQGYFCSAPVPARLRAFTFEKLPALAQWYIGTLSMNDMARLMESNCGREEAAIAAYLN